MKQGTVKFSKEFVTSIGTKEWVGCEMEYDMNTEDPLQVLNKARDTVIGWYTMNSIGIGSNWPMVEYPDGRIPATTASQFVPPGPPPVINVERTSEDIRVAELIKDIYACTELDGDNGLSSYEKLATSNKEAKAVYDIMYRKIAISNSIIK